jgi:hypothetical protein
MASQKFIGQCWFESSDNPTPIILDPSNGQITSTVAEINLIEAGELIGLNGGALLLGSDGQFIDSNLIFNQGGNLAGISFDGTDLFINAPNVVIANFDTSNINVNVNLDGINNQLNNLSNDINLIELNVGNLQNDFGNVSNLVGDAYNQANFAYNQANSAFNSANSAFNVANSSFNQANSAYNQANSATILAGNAYNQANSYLNSLNTNQIIVNSADLIFGVNLSVSPQVRLQSNSSTAPVVRLYQNDGTDEKEVFISSADLTITHNYTSISDPESVPYVLFTEPANGVGVALHAGSVVPNFLAPGGSLYLQTTGEFYTSDGANWIEQSLAPTVRTKHIIVRDNANSDTVVNIDPANLSGIYINCNGGLENPSITLDKFNSTADSIANLDDNKLTIIHAFATEDQTQPYIRFFDSSSTALVNTAVYFGDSVPSHSASNGSLFIQGGSAPNLYQYNGTAWAGVGGGGGGSPSTTRIMSRVPNASTSLPANGVITKILWNTLDFNQSESAYFTWDNTNAQYNILQTGAYTIDAQIGLPTLQSGAGAIGYVYVNGVQNFQTDTEVASGAVVGYQLQFSRSYLFNAGATVDLRANTISEGSSRQAGVNRLLSHFQLSTVA